MVVKRVMLGMSGGVDSSVAALLLKKQGYDVLGLFMNNWHGEDDVCTAESDYADVRRVCGVLDIPYYTVDLSEDYFKSVFALFLEEYKKGRTPNPDVLCNREIKFGVFADFAKRFDCDYVATGHYCGIQKKNGRTYLVRAKDENKCQTYFLNQVTEKQIENVVFPLENLLKPEVRKIALDNGLVTAKKKDSTGICFIGERNFRRFLSQYIPMKKGEIRTLDERVVGEHDGVFFYTEGQRKGFGLGGLKGETNDEPWFIIRKDVENNVLYVNQGEVPELYSSSLTTGSFNFITETLTEEKRLLARIRHRQPLVPVTARPNADGSVSVIFDEKQRAVAAGQYCVLYDDRVCLGGGVIEKTQK